MFNVYGRADKSHTNNEIYLRLFVYLFLRFFFLSITVVAAALPMGVSESEIQDLELFEKRHLCPS